MKRDVCYGPVAMVPLLARLVLAAQINMTSEGLKNIANVVGNNEIRRFDQSFEENLYTLTNASNEYELWQHSKHQPPAVNHLKRGASYTPVPPWLENATTTISSTISRAVETTIISSTTPSSTILRAVETPTNSSTMPYVLISKPPVIPINDIRQTNLDSSILKNSLLLTSEEKRRMERLGPSIDTSEAKSNKTNNELSLKHESEDDGKSQLDIKQGPEYLKRRTEESEERYLSQDIIRYIESDHFALAAKKLQTSSHGNYEYVYAVRKVYNHNAVNFELLLRFCDAVQDVNQKVKILDALFNEMKACEHTDSQKLRELTERIKNGILVRAMNSTIAIEAQNLLDRISTLDIVPNLWQFRLDFVQERLKMGNNRSIRYAVDRVLHHGGNSDLIMSLAKFVKETELKLKLYESLNYEMSSNDRNNMAKLLELTERIKTDILDGAVNATATAAQAVLNNVVTDSAKHHLSSDNYESAVETLNMGNNRTYKYAVNKIYANQSANFNSVLRLGNLAENKGEKLLIYDALYNEMRANGHNDSQDISLLKRSIYNAIPNQATDGAGFNATRSLLNRINRNEVIECLQNREFASAARVMDKCEENIYESVVNEMYPQSPENFKMLKGFGNSLTDQPKQLKYFKGLHKTMKTHGRNDTTEVAELIESIETAFLNKTTASRTLFRRNTNQGIKPSQTIETWIEDIPEDPLIAEALSFFNHLNYDNIIDHIKLHEFAQAEQKLVNCSNVVYVFVIKEIYDQHPDNFNLLLNFANSTQDVAEKFRLYNVLCDTIKNSSHPDGLHHLLRLYSTMENELKMDLENYSPMEPLFDALKKEVIVRASELISNEFVKNVNSTIAQLAKPTSSGIVENATSLSEVQQLSYKISRIDFYLLYSVYNAAIKNVSEHEHITINILIMESFFLNQLIERMAVHEAIVNLLGYDFFLTAKIKMVLFARQMKLVRTNPAYEATIPQFWRTKYEELERLFPPIVRHIVFSSWVCIRTIAYDEYLSIAEDTLDETRRYIRVGPIENKKVMSSHRWSIQFKSDFEENIEVYFQNEKFGEFLFSDKNNFYQGNKDNTLVFASQKRNVSIDSLWGLQTDGKAVYIKAPHKGYLYANGLKRKANSVEHFVFTSQNDTRTKNSKWEIVDCTL